MNTEPLFSVVIPVHNQEKWISIAVKSALEQGRDDVEVIAVNDGSTDGSARELAKFADRIMIVSQDKSGASGARNRGILEARGKWVAFLDADDRWRAGHLDRIAAAIAQRPEAGLIFTDGMYIDEDGREIKEKRSRPLGENQFRSLLTGNVITTSSAAVKKEILDRVGPFSPDFKGCEDWDLWLRVARHYPLVHISEITMDYRRQDQSSIHTLGMVLRQGNLEIVARAVASDPELPPATLRQALANCYVESAIRFLAAVDAATARQELMLALRQQPFSPRTWGLLILALAGKPGVKLALKIRRGN